MVFPKKSVPVPTEILLMCCTDIFNTILSVLLESFGPILDNSHEKESRCCKGRKTLSTSQGAHSSLTSIYVRNPNTISPQSALLRIRRDVASACLVYWTNDN